MRTKILIALSVITVFGACRSVYYSTMEMFDIEKRDILVDRVEEARDAQEETKETFESTLEELSALVDFDGGDLERLYRRLSNQLDDAEGAARKVRNSIESVERVSTDLFREWDEELEQYNSDSLRQQSEQQLIRTKKQYDDLIAKMLRAEEMIPPVLTAFRDQVLFLKHNLNAKAIASLKNEALRIEDNVKSLIAEMNMAIEEADAFIASMK